MNVSGNTEDISAVSVPAWQPIETLPRDGRFVIVYRPLAMETGDETLTITKTIKGKTPTVSPQGVKHWTERWCHPTHWMDLPELPKGIMNKTTSTSKSAPEQGVGAPTIEITPAMVEAGVRVLAESGYLENETTGLADLVEEMLAAALRSHAIPC